MEMATLKKTGLQVEVSSKIQPMTKQKNAFVYLTRMLFCSLKNALQYSFAKCPPEKMKDKESIQNIVPQNLLILVNIPI